MKKDSKKDSAVSPVIGTILLVAITVVLVAIISAVVMGMTGNVGTQHTVGILVDDPTGGAASASVLVTVSGGSDVDSLNGVSVTINGITAGSISGTDLVVGKAKKCTAATDTVTSGTEAAVVVTGTFKDGNTQVLFDQKLLFV